MKKNHFERLFENIECPNAHIDEVDEPIKCDHCNNLAIGEFETTEYVTRYKAVERLCKQCKGEIIMQGFFVDEMEGYDD